MQLVFKRYKITKKRDAERHERPASLKNQSIKI